MRIRRALLGKLSVALFVAAALGLSVPAAHALSGNGTETAGTTTVATGTHDSVHRIPVICPGCPSVVCTVADCD